ncbi:MAG: class I SAM-dependent methyltransferase [Hyphomicrobiaceae bacterium]
MSGFSTDWLALREAADHRARNGDVSEALQAHFALRDQLNIVDLGCGTGANLRATAPLLPARQSWQLIDHDAVLLDAARQELADWADSFETTGDTLTLIKDSLTLDVRFQSVDLAKDLDIALGDAPDLVTASALFDLASPQTIAKTVQAIAKRRSAFYTALTYNGVQQWKPRHPSDNALIAAYHHHQRIDKGFGPAAGPTAAAILADRFQASGYIVSEGSSPWVLSVPRDGPLIAALQLGYVTAVMETEKVEKPLVESWGRRELSGAIVGHTDTLAIPGQNIFMDDGDDDDDEDETG